MKLLFLVAVLLWSGYSNAQLHDQVRGPNGGKLQQMADIEIELLVGDHDVTLYAYDQSKGALDLGRYKASVDVVTGGIRQQIQLQPKDRIRLFGLSSTDLRPYSTLTLYVTTPAGVTETIKF